MMAKKTGGLVTPRDRSNDSPEGDIGPEQRWNMIREAAYFRYVQRDLVPGHDLDDWLAAEAESFSEEAEPEPVETAEFGMQEGGVHGFWEDDAMKRIIKQHPGKGISQVESMEPQQAPSKV
ncbi:MAG: DUF2934 domain-containing protein [Candidatus Nitrotoga sp.]|nr:DUF2934 domain-containing protein [Candidatus Nitrotoga sp.]